jgi:hypothetical protein
VLCAKGRAPIRLKALLCAACSVPRPQFVRQIDEIWGVRCACRVCALACPDLTSHPCGRYANLAELSEEDRENKLEVGKIPARVRGGESSATPTGRVAMVWSISWLYGRPGRGGGGSGADTTFPSLANVDARRAIMSYSTVCIRHLP